jgi:hypothetical protein
MRFTIHSAKIAACAAAAVVSISANAFGTITFNGNINEAEWGAPLATSAGGPAPGFGAGHEVNALYASGDNSNIFLGLAGNVQNGNRIVVFLDTKAGGYNSGDYGRDNAPSGVHDFNSGTTFDAGFNADYALVIGTNGTHDDYFFDLFTLAGTAGGGGGSNTFLGDINTPGLGGNPANSDNTRGFEVTIPKAAVGYTQGSSIQAFAMYMSDGAFLSNQFLTHAGSGDGNYGNGSVTFSAAQPDPVTIPASALPEPGAIALLAVAGVGALRRRRAR